MGGTRYPCVSGHEVVDHVTAVGGAVRMRWTLVHDIESAYGRILKSDIKYRFGIDNAHSR